MGIKIIDVSREELEVINKLTPKIEITDEILELAGHLDAYDNNESQKANIMQDFNKIKELITKYESIIDV